MAHAEGRLLWFGASDIRDNLPDMHAEADTNPGDLSMTTQLKIVLLVVNFLCQVAQAQILIESAPPGNLQALTASGTVVPGASLLVSVAGEHGSPVYLGLSLSPAYSVLPRGTLLIDAANMLLLTGTVAPSGPAQFSVGPLPPVPPGTEFYMQAALNPSPGVWRITNRVRATYMAPPQALQIVGVQNREVTVGDTLQFTVSAMGGQAPVMLSAAPMPLPPNMSLDAATGTFVFQPDTEQSGTYQITFAATDASGTVAAVANITANLPPPGTPTSLSGRVYDAVNQTPIQGVLVRAGTGSPSTTTASDGTFHLIGLPSGTVTIVFDGTGLTSAAGYYPFLPEPFDLMSGVENTIERPVYLPLIPPTGVQVVPGQPTMVPIPATMPGTNANLVIAPGSATTPQGQPFSGSITIADVPPQQAPLALPENLQPSRLISIQPGGTRFNPPAQISWPNDDNLQPGTPLQIWSVDGQTGQFQVVGMAEVQPNGSITTISGGISEASWHAAAPVPVTLPPDVGPGAGGMSGNGPACGSGGSTPRYTTGSETEPSTGVLHEYHMTAPYRTAEVDRYVKLHYNSSTADTRAIIQYDATITAANTVPLRMSTIARIGSVSGLRSFVNSGNLSEAVDESVRATAEVPSLGFPTGVYAYTGDVTSHYANAAVSTPLSGRVAIHNRQQSPIGIGWGIEGIDRLFVQADGSVLLASGSGETLEFAGSGVQPLFTDNFDGENSGTPQLNYANFANWTVTQGCVDLVGSPLFGFYPADGLYVDLDGTCFNAGTIESTTAFLLPPGVALLQFEVSGSQRCCGTDVLNVSLGSVWSESFVIPWDAARQVITRAIPVSVLQSAKLRFSHLGGDNSGILLLGVQLSRPNASLSAPAYDFSTLVRNPEGTYTRRLKDGTLINFDIQGRQTAIIDRSGNATTFTYDVLDRIQSIVDPVGQTNPSAGTLVFVYTGQRLGSIIDPFGRVTQIEHDLAGHLTRIVDPDGSSREFSYDGFGHLRSQRKKNGFVTTYTFDSHGRHISALRPDASTALVSPGNNQLLADPASGNGLANSPVPAVRSSELVSLFTDGRGKISQMESDRLGRTMRSIDALGRVTLYERNAAGLPTKITRPNGAVMRITYDMMGNTLSLIQEGSNGSGSDDRVVSFTYDPLYNQVLTITDPKQNLNSTSVTTRVTYDGFGRPVSIRDANDTITNLFYDESGLGAPGLFGLLTTVISASGQPEETVTRYAYNSFGMALEITDPEGRKTAFSYTPAGFVQTVTVKGNSISATDDETTTYAYDALNRVTSITDAIGGVTTLSYFPDGNLREVRDAKVNPGPGITTYQYDVRSRVQSRTDPLGRTENYFYDGDDNLTRMVDRKGQAFDWVYDDVGRLVQRLQPSGAGGIETISFGYQINTDNLSSAVDADSALGFVWNSFDELIGSTTAGSSLQPDTLITYSYDKNGNRTAMTGSASGQNFTAVSYVNDKLNRLQTMMDSVLAVQVGFSYDRLSRRTSMTRITSAQSFHTCHTYNLASDLTQLEHRTTPTAACGSGTLISRFAYGYNAIGLRSTMTEDRPAFGIASATHSYSYDLLNRLTSALHPNDPAESFTYDSVGNRRTSGPNPFLWQYNDSDQLLNDGSHAYTYDLNGNRQSRTDSTTNQVSLYFYDAQDRIRTVTSGTTMQTLQAYDALDRRIRVAGATGTRSYVYDGEDVILITEGPSRTTILHGAGIDEPLAYNSGFELTLPFADALGSVTEESTASGLVLQASRYNSFGSIVAALSLFMGSHFGYTSREFDSGIETQYSRARHYDSRTGRFLQEDPMGLESGHSNSYWYCAGNPVNSTDPSGALFVCSRPVDGFPFIGNHAYLWDPITNRAEGMRGSSNSGLDSVERGWPHDACNRIEGGDKRAKDLLDLMEKTQNSGMWFPGLNDCHNAVDRVLRDSGVPNPGAPGGRLGRIPPVAPNESIPLPWLY